MYAMNGNKEKEKKRVGSREGKQSAEARRREEEQRKGEVRRGSGDDTR